MAARKTICFAEPAQLAGFLLVCAGTYFSPPLPLLWRYACLLSATRLTLQCREPRR